MLPCRALFALGALAPLALGAALGAFFPLMAFLVAFALDAATRGFRAPEPAFLFAASGVLVTAVAAPSVVANQFSHVRSPCAAFAVVTTFITRVADTCKRIMWAIRCAAGRAIVRCPQMRAAVYG